MSSKMGDRSSPCASCRFLRRRCTKDCIFVPYFPPDDSHKFAVVHKVFGASNISKMLQELPEHQRADAVSSIVYEANARMRDPVYGCAGAISHLQNQVTNLQMQLAKAQAQISTFQMQQKPVQLEAYMYDDQQSFLFQNIDMPDHYCNVSIDSQTNYVYEGQSLEGDSFLGYDTGS